jgi:hypothetical protein
MKFIMAVELENHTVESNLKIGISQHTTFADSLGNILMESHTLRQITLKQSRRHSSKLDIQHFRGSDCDNDHDLVVHLWKETVGKR